MRGAVAIILGVDVGGDACVSHGCSRSVDGGVRRECSAQFVGDGRPPIVADEI
jgi:hypothetical protein